MINFLRLFLVLLGGLSQPGLSTEQPDPVVIINTTEGSIVAELYPQAAPLTVANFLRYVDEGHYKGSSFYRVVRSDNQQHQPVKIDIIQGGLGISNEPPPLPPIAHESTDTTHLKHQFGTLSMARLEPGSASSEFFICVSDQPELDFGGKRFPDGLGFAAFGRVIAGMEVVRKIQASQVNSGDGGYARGQMLSSPVRILNIARQKP